MIIYSDILLKYFYERKFETAEIEGAKMTRSMFYFFPAEKEQDDDDDDNDCEACNVK